MQTAIIIRQFNGEEILVRLEGIHVPADKIDVDTRGKSWESWCPVDDSHVEVRLEGAPKYRVTFCGRLKGAIGVFESFDVVVEARDSEAALASLYDTYEHISAAVVEAQ